MVITKVETLMKDQSTWTVMIFEKFIVEHRDILHPTNNCMIRIKNSLVGFYGRSPGFEVQQLVMKPSLLERKEQLADEVYKVLNLLQPGICSVKGKDNLVFLNCYTLTVFVRLRAKMCVRVVNVRNCY